MEKHKAKMQEYDKIKEELIKEITESNANNQKFNSMVMLKLVNVKSGEVYKESEKIRK